MSIQFKENFAPPVLTVGLVQDEIHPGRAKQIEDAAGFTGCYNYFTPTGLNTNIFDYASASETSFRKMDFP